MSPEGRLKLLFLGAPSFWFGHLGIITSALGKSSVEAWPGLCRTRVVLRERWLYGLLGIIWVSLESVQPKSGTT
jgi:hypothetical protein